jgi:NADH-quinone oxidoreductase subunit L
MSQLLAWSFLFPLATLALSALGVPKKGGVLSWLSPAAIFAVALGCLLTGQTTGDVVIEGWAPFLGAGKGLSLKLHVDALTVVMLLVVGGVATCVFIYALGYMAHDPRRHRFFAFLDLFIIAMTLLVVAGNVPVLLVGWAGVGVASFLLISFWWQKGHPLEAGFLALGANAIGDAALLLAAVLIGKATGGDGLHELAALDNIPGVAGVSGQALLAWCFVIAACAKSAQGPLWWWLPSAMAGPTPVSALIHAATMVAAGVYLVVRASPLIQSVPEVWYTTALIGVSTAILGGVASLWQRNFKRGLAYSTVSQLGWMFAAAALGSPFAAMFHLVTHAAFKAMLFLSAGTVIEATHHEEDIRRLGGLAKKLPVTNALFLLGSACLIGTPFLSGSFSKDAILEAALHSQAPFLGWVLLGGALITGAYAGRLYAGVFLGAPGASSEHVHAPGFALFSAPLLPLALGAVALGYAEAGTHALSGLLKTTMTVTDEVHLMPTMLGLGAFGIGLVGFGLGVLIARTQEKSLPLPPIGLWHALWGELRALPEGVAALHSGRVGRYALLSALGAAAVLALSLAPPKEALAHAPAAGAITKLPPRAPPKAKGEAAKARAKAEAASPGDKARPVQDDARSKANEMLRQRLRLKPGEDLGKALKGRREDALKRRERDKQAPEQGSNP